MDISDIAQAALIVDGYFWNSRSVKGHKNCIFETPHNKIKCVLIVKESNFNEEKIKIFTYMLTVRAEVAEL